MAQANATFPEFIELVVYGYSELSKFFEANNLDMSSPTEHMDTGMVDGDQGLSRKWNSYWRTCGICHPHSTPDYIIHMEHLKEDFRVDIY